MRDLHSKDEEVEHRAQLALNLLCDMGVWRENSVPPRTSRGSWRLVGRRGGLQQGNVSEREVRRRRREAVVIHDGDGAIGNEDVYMRDQQGWMSAEMSSREFEGELEQLERLVTGSE